MHTIVKILGVEIRKKGDKNYSITHVVLEDGEEATGWGAFEVGDKVMRWYDPQHDKVKVKKLT